MDLKRSLVIVLIVTVSVSFLFAGGTSEKENEQIVWKLASKMAPTSIEGQGFQVFVDKVSEYSNGRMRIDIYPSEQLGGTDSIMEMLKEGTVEVYVEAPTYLDRYVPEFAYLTLPFMFNGRDHWNRFVESSTFKEWEDRVAEEQGIVLIGSPADFPRGPYNVLCSTKPILSLEDVQGLKLRMPPVDKMIAVWDQLGADPMVLDWTEVYGSLQTGLIEAAGSPIGLVEQMGFHEVAKYILVTDELPQGISFMGNKAAYDSLPEDLKEVVQKAAKDAGDFSSSILYDQAEKSVESMKESGVTFNKIDMTPFVNRVKELYNQWVEDGELSAEVLQAIDEYR